MRAEVRYGAPATASWRHARARLSFHAALMERIELVEEHVRCENAHDLAGLMSTFGSEASYEDEPWSERHLGHAAVREYYRSLLAALPDLHIAVNRKHSTPDAIILEVVISGTHLGAWRGLPPTGRRVEFPLCGIFTFGRDAKLSGERIYYDRAAVLHQIGVFHEPTTFAGRIVTPLAHPLTMARVLFRLGRVWRRPHAPSS